MGYWHNWNDGNAPYLELSQVDPRYTVIEVSFAVPAAGSAFDMVFAPAETAPATFIADVAALQAQGRKVLISIGGANATVHLDSDAERDQFVSSMLAILDTYGFDGLDIDLEGASVAISGGTIANPTDARIIRLIDAVNSIADQYEVAHGVPMMLTMAPETAYVQGGMSAYGGIWGAYLPLIDALRNRLDILQVQLYNSGSMYGIDGGIYTQGTADFIVSQTEALLQGFTTSGGFFAPLPPEKVAIGLPACPLAAGGGYVTPAVLEQAVDYLRGTGPQPGSYQRVATYPTLRGLMTWSINWDAVGSCAMADEYAQAYEDIFGISTAVQEAVDAGISVWPVPVDAGVLHIGGLHGGEDLLLLDALGRAVAEERASSDRVELTFDLPTSAYVLRVERDGAPVSTRRVLVVR
ncbi:MAG TPA: chitinase [Flavobacteriales bacterium]|nr:chitinase [Flavobacteriales bacterium]HMR26553.1 chitinase [Flavobacteriales bacterium]